MEWDVREANAATIARKRGFNMGIIAWIILGAISGFIANKIYDGQGNGFLLNTALGIVGAVVGGWIAGTFFHMGGVTGAFNIWSILVSVLGAIVVLFVYNKVAR